MSTNVVHLVNEETGRPNFWHYSGPCPHNEVAFNSTTVWCETCGADIEAD